MTPMLSPQCAPEIKSELFFDGQACRSAFLELPKLALVLCDLLVELTDAFEE